MADNKKLAADVLQAVGGSKNVSNVAHCFTRLRFNLKDRSLVDDDVVKAVPGVLGMQEQGGQYQVIIGPSVPEVYKEVVAQGVAAGGSVDEQLDAPTEKKPLTPKQIGANILDYISGTVVPLIPILIVGALFKTLGTIAGPTFLNLVASDSEFVALCDMVYNASFYFMPITAGYSAAKKLGVNPFLGALIGCFLIEPTYVSLASTEGASFSVYGIPMPINSYGSTLIPALLSVWILSYVAKFFDRVVPASLRTVFSPFLTMVVMLPLTYGVLAPLGSYAGNGLGAVLNWLATTPLYPVVVGIVGATWPLLVLTGMHLGVAAVSLAQFAETGVDNLVLMAVTVVTFTATFAGLAALLRIKNKEEKALAAGYIVTQCFGGVGEPLIFGVFMKYPRTWIGMIVGGFVGSFLAAILGVCTYAPAQGFFSFLNFAGGTSANFVTGMICLAVSCIVTFVVTYLFGFSKEELAAMEEDEQNAHGALGLSA